MADANKDSSNQPPREEHLVIEYTGFWNSFGNHNWNSNEMTEPVKCISWKPSTLNNSLRMDNSKQGFVLDALENGTKAPNVQNGTLTKVQPEDDVPQWKQVMGALTVSWLNFIVGYSTGFVSPAIASMNSKESNFKVSENEISWIGSLMPLFALVGSSLGGFSLDKLGRKWTIILGGTPFVPSFALTYLASKVWMVMVGRVLSGVAIGLTTVSVPVYLGELTGPKVRGFYGLLPTTSGNLGILVATLLGVPLNWRNMALVGFASTLPYFALVFFLVESPVWQSSMRNKKIDKIIFTDEDGNPQTYGYFSTKVRTYCRRQYLLPFFICLGLHVVQQFCGINAVITYATQIFQAVNTSIDPLLSAVIVSIVNVLSTLLATFLVDKVGRKILMYVSLAMLLASNIALAVYYHEVNAQHVWTLDYDWLPLTALAIFILGFSLGAGPIPWLVLGEVLPEKIRGTSASIVTAAHWVFTFAVTKTFVDISEKYGTHVPFAGYAIVCLMGLCLMYIVPETAGKTLEEIQNKMKKRKPEVSVISQPDMDVSKVTPTC